MTGVSYTLVTDGSSDRALTAVLTWLLEQHLVRFPVRGEWTDLRRLPRPPQRLPERICTSLELYPCDVLFIHRDAEKQSRQLREQEIREAAGEALSLCPGGWPTPVSVVPVRMTEAWLLFDESALRRAAGNPAGRAPLEMPPLARLEQHPDPKGLLHQLLCAASRRTGRRLKQFNVRAGVQRLAEQIDDFAPLRALPAFVALEKRIVSLAAAIGA